MNCDVARNRLMALPDPAAVPGPLAAHLDGCSACQTWHHLLVRVEGAIVATAPPPSASQVKRKLVEQFRPVAVASARSKVNLKKPALKPVATVRPASPRQTVGERLARLWPAGLVAAALLAGVLVWTSLRGGKPDGSTVAAAPPDEFLDKVVMAKVKLDTAPNATARLDVLDTLATDIHVEAKTLAKVTPGAEMESLARMYQQVVAELELAGGLSLDEARLVLPRYVTSLANAEKAANLALNDAPPDSVQPLKEIALAAQQGRIKLSKKMQG